MNRLRYIGKRLALGVPVVWFGLTMAFVIMYIGPIDPVFAILGRDATPSAARSLRLQLGLIYEDGTPVPLWDQYLRFMKRMVTLNFGDSWVITRGMPVTEVIWGRMAATVWLGFWSVMVAIFIGIPVGLWGGLNANTWRDYTASAGGIVWRAMPNFWLAIILASVISSGGPLQAYQEWLIPTTVVGTPDVLGDLVGSVPVPIIGGVPVPKPYNMAKAFKWILPAALVLGSSSMGNEVRIGRTAVIESMNAKYIETAKAKGVSMRSIIVKHVGRNAVIPLLPVIMGEFYLLIGGSVIVESVFSINGIGNLFLAAAFANDIPVLMALTFIFVVIMVVFNITQDILYTFIDPRITLEDANR